MKAFSFSELSYTTDKAGNQVDLERLLVVEGYRIEVALHEDEDDPDLPFKIDASYYDGSGKVAASLEIERFFTESGTPYLDIDKLDVTETGKGLGTKIFTKILDLADTLDIKLLRTFASRVGSYSWGVLGFYPSLSEWPELYKAINERSVAQGLGGVNIPTRFDLPKFARDSPKELLLDLNWFGTMNLTDEEQMQHCRDYIDTKLGRARA